MAKFYGNAVKTGKLGGSVFAIRYGETIERQYQPIVANPSTELQMAARAKLKMLSQLSAVVGNTIAIPRVGAVSKRNMFTKINYPLTQFTNHEASIDMTKVQLTNSAVAFPQLYASRVEGGISVSVSSVSNVDRVVYVAVVKNEDSKLRLFQTEVVSTPGADNNFQTLLNEMDQQLFVLAYGIRDNSDAARAVFGNLASPDAEVIAKIVTSRTLLDSDFTMTETRGISLAAGA